MTGFTMANWFSYCRFSVGGMVFFGRGKSHPNSDHLPNQDPSTLWSGLFDQEYLLKKFDVFLYFVF